MVSDQNQSTVTTKRFASGKYFEYVDGSRIPGCIIGGKNKFMLEIGCKSYGPFKTITRAAQFSWEREKNYWKEGVYSGS